MDENAVMSGSLNFISLADVFQVLGSNGSSGVLRIKSRFAPETGIVYFRKGDPINAVCGSLRGVKAIYNLFGWTEGDYSFQEEDLSQVDRQVTQNRMEIILEAMRMLDNGDIKRVGPGSFCKKLEGKEGPIIKGPFLDYLHVVKESIYRDGDKIVEEGKHGKWIWAVYQGTVKVTRETEKGPLLIARLGEGCFIGTFRALMFGEYERNATVTAEGNVLLGLLDSEPFYHEYASLSRHFRRLLLSLDDRLRRLNDKAVELSVNGDNGFMPRNNGHKYVRREIPREELYTITAGNARIVRPAPQGYARKGYLPLLSLNRDDLFGDIPFMDFGHEPRSASVLASKDLKTEKLDTQRLQGEYDRLSPTFKKLIHNMGMYIAITTNLVSRSCNWN